MDRQTWNGTKQKELTNEWNQTKGGEVLDRRMREKARLLFFSLSSSSSSCEDAVCLFFTLRSTLLSFNIQIPNIDAPGTMETGVCMCVYV